MDISQTLYAIYVLDNEGTFSRTLMNFVFIKEFESFAVLKLISVSKKVSVWLLISLRNTLGVIPIYSKIFLLQKLILGKSSHLRNYLIIIRSGRFWACLSYGHNLPSIFLGPEKPRILIFTKFDLFTITENSE